MLDQFFSQISFVDIFNFCVFITFSICYTYQLYYVFVVLTRRPPERVARKNHRFAVVVSARNESAVIADLIHSIKVQNYPQELIDVFVVADNCTDNTADVAREAGATVFPRFNTEQVGKGYALDYGFSVIRSQYADRGYEAYFVFDADNVLDVNYFREMNATFDSGAKASTSYRNSKNYDSNWISAGYAVWFLREAKFLNQARLTLNTSCAVSGTGFFIAADLIEKHGGWKWHLLTEDIEFSVYHILQGRTIGFCADAVLYDEQPATFRQSWRQRLRWARGFLQVFRKYGFGLVKGMGKGSFSCYDMSMTVMPAFLLTVALIVSYLVVGLSALGGGVGSEITFFQGLYYILQMLAGLYGVLFVVGLFTTITEWENIHTTPAKKVLYTITFPIFMLTYIPISLVALFSRKVQWKPIQHHRADRRVLEAAAAGTKRIQNQ